MEEFKTILNEISPWVKIILGFLFGGFIGFRIGVKKSVKQSQKAGDNSKQTQIGGNYVRK